MKCTDNTFTIPATVPLNQVATYQKNYAAITRDTGNLLLFSADQKVEHLNTDFYGPDSSPENNDPEHLFYIAAHAPIGALATQLGLVSHYAACYPASNYIIKLNSKTDLVKKMQQDPCSLQLWSVEDVVAFAHQTGLPIRGIGYTVYLGSEHEAAMLTQAAQAIYQAHHHGLITIVWMYPRGKAVAHERDGALIAGAAGVAACLGADFAKIHPPHDDATHSSLEWLAVAAQAAGKTKLLCSGGPKLSEASLLQKTYDWIKRGNCNGIAVGRNIHQRTPQKAIAFAHALSALVYDGTDVKQALTIAQGP